MRRARTKGAYASTTMSCFWQKSQISVRVLNGWTSIWLIAGSILGLLWMSSCSFKERQSLRVLT